MGFISSMDFKYKFVCVKARYITLYWNFHLFIKEKETAKNAGSRE